MRCTLHFRKDCEVCFRKLLKVTVDKSQKLIKAFENFKTWFFDIISKIGNDSKKEKKDFSLTSHVLKRGTS